MKTYQVRARARVVSVREGHLRLDVAASVTVRASSAEEARDKAREILAARQKLGNLMPDGGLEFETTSAGVVQVA